MRTYAWITLIAAVALAGFVLSPMAGQGKKPSLSDRIAGKQAEVGKAKRKEGVLTTDISGFNNRIRGLNGQIGTTQKRLGTVQDDLDAERRRLLTVRDRLEVARDKLVRAKEQLKVSRTGLRKRLVELYKADQPDVLTVVLSSDGFDDLLDRTDFLQRISERDGKVLTRVRVLKKRAQRSEQRLASLERERQRTAQAVLRRRDDIASVRDRLSTARGDLRTARNGRRTLLTRVRGQRHEAQEDLRAMEAQQEKIRARLAGAPPPGAIRRGSGRLIWPVNGPITGSFGEQRPGHIHAGIDIAAPDGTPIRAADSGTVRLLGSVGGYGNYTCVQHTASLSTCYGHQSRFGTSQGASVKQGQVIGYVGNTGNSSGPHLHFEVRQNGSPVSPLGYL